LLNQDGYDLLTPYHPSNPDCIRAAFREALDGRVKPGRVPELCDGHATDRMAARDRRLG
jgi:hypothetical protein